LGGKGLAFGLRDSRFRSTAAAAGSGWRRGSVAAVAERMRRAPGEVRLLFSPPRSLNPIAPEATGGAAF